MLKSSASPWLETLMPTSLGNFAGLPCCLCCLQPVGIFFTLRRLLKVYVLFPSIAGVYVCVCVYTRIKVCVFGKEKTLAYTLCLSPIPDQRFLLGLARLHSQRRAMPYATVGKNNVQLLLEDKAFFFNTRHSFDGLQQAVEK